MAPSFNTKNPTIKRILKEAHELATNPSPDYHAAPLETNLFEWHFTLRGPPASAFASGIYHGRIVLPPSYPLRPPSFRFLTPSGRFEVNREICLSISGHHEESWQPAWGLRTALVALRSFMETDVKGQLGGVEAAKGVRERLAIESRKWKCSTCSGKSNEDIIKETEQAALQNGHQDKPSEVEIPKELSLGYKDELEAAKNKQNVDASGAETSKQPSSSAELATVRAIPEAAPRNVTVTPPSPNPLPPWIDKAIFGIAIALAYLLLQRFLAMS